MELWRAESNQRKQTVLSLVSVAAGLVLVTGFRDFHSSGMTNRMAGFLLGIFLLLIGVMAFASGGKQTIVVDPNARCITIEDTTYWGKKTRAIAFNEVVHVGIGYLGRHSNYVAIYYLVLKLRSGEDYSLFAPGRFYEGASDRSIVEGWQRRLETYIGISFAQRPL